MGREIKRVPLNFDWPINKMWPPYLGGICTKEVSYAIRASEDVDCDVICEACRHAAKLAGVAVKSFGCPDWKIHPPAGEGYQLWETISEGSPISPVFTTPEELADWLIIEGNDTSVTKGTTREQWLAMIRGPGWAPSLIRNGDGVHPGVQTG